MKAGFTKTSLSIAARKPLASALLLALLAPGVALAQSAKEKELEARVAQLEAQVQALLGTQQQQQTQLSDTKTQLDQVSASQASSVPAGKQPIQTTTITPAAAAGTTFTYGGFVKMDAMATDTSAGEIADGAAGRLFYVPGQIPVGPDANSDAQTDFHAQFSRVWLSADKTTDNGDKFKGYVEFDFFGGGNNTLAGNENATNTYALTLRHAYVQWNHWLAGQTWTNFQDVAALPDAVDFLGPTEGTVFVRQAQVRYSKGAWSFSAENPVTRYAPAGSGITTNSNSSQLPDLTARWTTKGDWGHFTAAALLRQLHYRNGSASDDETGAALSVSGKFNLGSNDDLRYMVNAGNLGRYVGLGLQSADAVLDASGNLDAVSGYSGFVGWRHVFNAKLRGNLYYSAAMYDNKKDLTGFNASSPWNERLQSIHANLIYSPFPKLDVGAEIGYGKRELEDNREGDLKRIQTTVKYSF